MKSRLNQFLSLVLITCVTNAQPPEDASLAIIGPIPLLVHTNVYLEMPSDENAIIMMEGRMRIARIMPGTAFFASHTLNYGRDAKPYGYALKSCSYYVNGQWIRDFTFDPATEVLTEDSLIMLLDFIIRDTERHEFIFRGKEDESDPYRITFIGHNFTPELGGWRSLANDDSVSGELVKEVSAYSEGLHKKIFEPAKKNIKVEKTRNLQFNFNLKGVHADSLLEYRFLSNDNANNSHWSPTGHLLTIPYNDYAKRGTLQVRYRGMPAFSTYYIKVEPRWFERPLFLVSVIVFLFSVIWFVFRYWHQKKLRLALLMQRELSAQLTAMQASITPHMLANSLFGLQELLVRGQWKKARMFTEGLGQLLKAAYTGKKGVYRHLTNELEEIKQFVAIQQLRFHFDFQLKIDMPGTGALPDMPTGLLQPVVENAIKYNLSATSSGGILTINVLPFEDGIKIMIEANSLSGNNRVGGSPWEGTGFGLEWVKTRLSVHNQLYPASPILLDTYFEENHSRVSFYFKNT